MATATEATTDFPLDLYERVREPLGRGAYGTVYRYELRDEQDGESLPAKIAVKEIFIKEKGIIDKNIVREHDTMKNACHPNIVKYFGKLAADRAKWFVMELCKSDLDTLSKSRDFSDMEVAAIMWQILKALNHLHKNKIVHRDVKPTNVLVQFDNEQHELKTIPLHHVTIKLGDFGLARYFSPDSSTMTTTGTKIYAAPEIRKNLEKKKTIEAMDNIDYEDLSTSKYTKSCDVFSAGILAHELITGKYQEDIEGYTDFTKLESSLGQYCDQNLLSLLKCMLHHDRNMRSSVGELLNHVFIKQGNHFLQNEKQIYELSESVKNLVKSESELVIQNQSLSQKVKIMDEDASGLHKWLTRKNKRIKYLEEEVQHCRTTRKKPLRECSQEEVNEKMWKASKDGDVETMKEALRGGAELGHTEQTFYFEGGFHGGKLSGFSGTPLHVAVSNGHRSAADLLLKEGADVNGFAEPGIKGFHRDIEMKDELTPLMLATMSGGVEMARMLIEEYGAVVNMSSINGTTALHFAAGSVNLPLCKLLVEVGKADINYQDIWFRTPLDIAKQKGEAGNLCLWKLEIGLGSNARITESERSKLIEEEELKGVIHAVIFYLEGKCDKQDQDSL